MDRAVRCRAEPAGGGFTTPRWWAADGERYIASSTVDGVHPNAAGYAVMAPLVEAAITVDQGK
jgi:lysophospholipase L1-like esterase